MPTSPAIGRRPNGRPGSPAGARRPVAASTHVRDLVTGPRRAATTLGAFPAAVYLAVADRVLAVVTRDAVRLPCALVVAAVSAESPLTAVGAGEPAVVGEGAAVLGPPAARPLVLPVARWWDPVPRLSAVDRAMLSARRAVLADELAGARTRPGLPLGADPLADDGPAGDLTRAAASDDVPAGEAALDGLLGRGPGLTPSGDDVVAGLLAGLRLLGAPGAAAYADALAARAPTATTALSAELLRAAARGAVAAPVAAVLRALTGAGDLPLALAGLVRVGSTSGADLAWGLLAGATAVVHHRREAA